MLKDGLNNFEHRNKINEIDLNLPAEISKLYELISMSKNIGVEVNLITSSAAVGAPTLLALMRRYLVSFTFFTTWHTVFLFAVRTMNL